MRLGAGAGFEPQFIEGKQRAETAFERAREVLCE
jgi:hypothetical protein